MNDNMDYKLTNYKSPAAIVKRTFTSGNKFSRSQIFHPDFYRLYKDNIELEANELPIFESCTRIGYILLTTKHLFVELQDQSHKIEIEKVIYESQVNKILERQSKRNRYMEYEFYSLITTDDVIITYAIDINSELLLDKCLSDVAWMVNKYRNIHEINNTTEKNG